MSRWKNGSTGPERRPRGSACVTMRFRRSSVGTSPFHSGVMLVPFQLDWPDVARAGLPTELRACADLARLVGTALVGEPRPHVHQCALEAVRRRHGKRVGGAQEREPETAPGCRLPAVRVFGSRIVSRGLAAENQPRLA